MKAHMTPEAPLLLTPPLPQKRKRAWGLWASFVVCVLLPITISAFYWMTMAPDRYVTQAGFSVRAIEESATTNILSSLTGMAGGTPNAADTAIIIAYLHNRDLIESLNAKLPLERIFQKTDDALYQYKGEHIEDMIAYWEHRMTVIYDTTTGLVTFEVEAFTPEDSYLLATHTLESVETLVNTISEKARSDVMAAAQEELTRAQTRLHATSEALRQYRIQQESLNPFGSGEALVEMIASVEADLSNLQRQITSLVNSNVRETSAPLVNKRRQEEAMLIQLETLRASSQQDAQQMAQFEQLSLEKQFAEESYAAAMASFEQARVRANSTQRYLAVFGTPQQAQSAVRPDRLLNTLLCALIAFAAWSIGTLITYHIRDKMA